MRRIALLNETNKNFCVLALLQLATGPDRLQNFYTRSILVGDMRKSTDGGTVKCYTCKLTNYNRT
jgi:hypothetical protein